ncbi:hypothetical protein V6N11_048840 [Hibiscus sabdariffa]|uniref:START domain-containing protein n=1 Tax=Hibiscus sabdariffa TaxID=183260 RepID=A0ABR2PWH1_9ROSI
MFAELQMLTPLVPTRQVYFARYCKRFGAQQWVIVDVSVDKVEENMDASLLKCRKRPSGCIIQESSNGHCKVIWVEHLECQKSAIHALYRTLIGSSLAFGARHWMATLQLQCERLVFFMATNVPTKDSTETKLVATKYYFDHLKSIANLAKGQEHGNVVTIQTIKSKENNTMWMLQDSRTNAFESMVVFAPVDITGMQSVTAGYDSSNIATLPSGFSILPDRLESRPSLITSRHKKSIDVEGGSLLTIAFQILTNNSRLPN